MLLVDDDQFAYEAVSLYLAEVQVGRFEIEWKSSYNAGMTALFANRYDVCLLDFQLGDRSGIDFIKEAVSHGSRTPIVMLTAKGDHELDMEAMRAGAADYLVKGEFGSNLLERVLRYTIERSRTLEALRESEDRYALAVAGANDGLWDWKLQSNDIYFSPRWKEILGYGDREIVNHLDEWYLRVHPDDLPKVKSDIAAHLSGSSAHFENEHRLLHKDGSYRWVLVRGQAVRNRENVATRLAGSLTDVTQSRGHDPLTGLPNRILYLDRLARVVERAKRRGDYSFAVLFLDLDRFKVVNDSLGHIVGDELLVGISQRLEACVRTADTVARMGGDEFTILLEDIKEPADATRVAQRIQEALAQPFKLGGREVFTSASIGIAFGASTYDRAEDVLRDADTAMYRAKAAGKACHEVFDKAMHARALATLQLETELRRAVELQDFRVFYQPIVSLETGEVVSFEALVRWNHPTRGIVPPNEFIPLAEETGLIVQIDRWVLNQACSQMRYWQEKFPRNAPLSISVNFSKKQLAQADLLDEVDRVLTTSKIAPGTLQLEITESVIMDNAEMATAMLGRLRARNIHLVMDDFGTGYSSLSYLHRLPFTSLKVDRSFVMQMGRQSDSTEIVRTIIGLARSFGLKVTAEGVETPEQIVQLKALGCDFAQGYLYAKPIDRLGAEALLVNKQKW